MSCVLHGTQVIAMVVVAEFINAESKVVTLITRLWSISRNRAPDSP